MDKDIQRFDLIQNYLDGKLSAADRQAFEAQLTTDADLADEVGTHRLEREMMDILLEDDMSDKLQEWQQEKEQMPPQSGSRMGRWMVILLVVVAIALLLIYLLRYNSQTTQNSTGSDPTQQDVPTKEAEQQPKKYNGPIVNTDEIEKVPNTTPNNDEEENLGGSPALAAAYQRMATELGGSPEFAGTFVRSAAEAESRFDSASVLIRDKRYDEAIRLLQTISNENPETFLNARLNLGYLYFVKKNFQAAIPHLVSVASKKDFLYAEAAEWYLTLAYLGSSQTNPMEKQLANILADTGHSYYQKAVALQKRLE